MLSELEIKRLIKRAIRGDAESFDALISSCHSKAYSLAYRYMQSEQDTLDVMQESYIKLYMNLEQFSFRSSFETWYFRILINCCYDELRKRGRQPLADEKSAGADDERDALAAITDKAKGPEEILISRERQEFVAKALAGLPRDFRDVLILREFQQLSYQEIAETLEISQGTVKSRINRAKKHLRDIIEEHYPDLFV